MDKQEIDPGSSSFDKHLSKLEYFKLQIDCKLQTMDDDNNKPKEYFFPFFF